MTNEFYDVLDPQDLYLHNPSFIILYRFSVYEYSGYRYGIMKWAVHEYIEASTRIRKKDYKY